MQSFFNDKQNKTKQTNQPTKQTKKTETKKPNNMDQSAQWQDVGIDVNMSSGFFFLPISASI